MADVALLVNGAHHRGWTSMRVQRGIEQASGAFEVAYSERWPGQTTAWPINPGDACQLQLDGESVITGYVDSAEVSLEAGARTLRVVGRDRAADLVDCAAVQPGEKTGAWHGARLDRIAADLARPYGVTVSAETDLGAAFSTHEIQPGESAWACLERAARLRAVLVVSDGIGGLIITRAGAQKHPAMIAAGQALRQSLARDDSQRFSRYVARGQNTAHQSDASIGGADVAATISTQGIAVDAAIARYRPTILMAEDLAEGVTVQDRAEWEAMVRRARGRRVSVALQGWGESGMLWRPNQRVQLDLPAIGIVGELLIVSVAQNLDDSGTISELELAPPEAYNLLATREKKKRKGKQGANLSPADAEMLRLLS
jgi:prophage tail gpP-like protein